MLALNGFRAMTLETLKTRGKWAILVAAYAH